MLVALDIYISSYRRKIKVELIILRYLTWVRI